MGIAIWIGLLTFLAIKWKEIWPALRVQMASMSMFLGDSLEFVKGPMREHIGELLQDVQLTNPELMSSL